MCYDSCDDWPLDGLAAAAAARWPALLISVVVLGVLAALNPLRPVVFVLVLRTRRVNAIAFLAGWALALSVLFGLVCRRRRWRCVRGVERPTAHLGLGWPSWSSARSSLSSRCVDGRVARTPQRSTSPRPPSPGGSTGSILKGAGVMGVLIQPRTLTIAAALVVARDRSGVPRAGDRVRPLRHRVDVGPARPPRLRDLGIR